MAFRSEINNQTFWKIIPYDYVQLTSIFLRGFDSVDDLKQVIMRHAHPVDIIQIRSSEQFQEVTHEAVPFRGDLTCQVHCNSTACTPKLKFTIWFQCQWSSPSAGHIFSRPMPFVPKAQKGIDKGKKSTRFWQRCIVGWKYTWASKIDRLFRESAWGRICPIMGENLSNFGGEFVQFWGRMCPNCFQFTNYTNSTVTDMVPWCTTSF